MKQFFISGLGVYNESGARQFFIPGFGFILDDYVAAGGLSLLKADFLGGDCDRMGSMR